MLVVLLLFRVDISLLFREEDDGELAPENNFITGGLAPYPDDLILVLKVSGLSVMGLVLFFVVFVEGDDLEDGEEDRFFLA